MPLASGLRYDGPNDMLLVLAAMLQTLVDVCLKPGLFDVTASLTDSPTDSPTDGHAMPLHSPTARTSPPDAVATVAGSAAVSYMGRSMCYGDFDGDGKRDMAVGAYGTGVKKIKIIIINRLSTSIVSVVLCQH